MTYFDILALVEQLEEVLTLIIHFLIDSRLALESFNLFLTDKLDQLLGILELEHRCLLVYTLLLRLFISRYNVDLECSMLVQWVWIVLTFYEVVEIGVLLDANGSNCPIVNSIVQVNLPLVGEVRDQTKQIVVVRFAFESEIPAVISKLLELIRTLIA